MADRRRLSRDDYVDAAVQLAEERGLDGVSMRELAARTGTTPMAVYHHVEDREALIRLVVDRVGAGIDVGDGSGSWDERLRAWAHGTRATLGRYPGTARWLMANPLAGPGAVGLVEGALDALLAAGLSERDAADGYVVLTTWVLARCDLDDQQRARTTADGSDRRAASEALLAGLDLGRYPATARVLPAFAALDVDDAFDAGLDIVLAGLAQQIEGPPGRSG